MAETTRSTLVRSSSPQFRRAVGDHITSTTGSDGPIGRKPNHLVRNVALASIASVGALLLGMNIGRQKAPERPPAPTKAVHIAKLITSMPKPGQELPKNGLYEVTLGQGSGVYSALALIAKAEGRDTKADPVSEALKHEADPMATKIAEGTRLDTIGPDTPFYLAPDSKIVDPSVLEPEATTPIIITEVHQS